jgi:CDP-diacylglycerol---glycerol-3-phosphate 3-phosphatidyltransferase
VTWPKESGWRGATIPLLMAVRAVPAPLAQLPNALTLFRFALIPLFVVQLLGTDGSGSYAVAAVFALAGATDQVDGWLARRWHVESQFGKLADPLADRLMIDAAVVLLWLDGRLPWPALAVIAARDGVLLLAYPAVRDRGYEFEVNLAGKTATWILYASLVGVIASDEGTDWPLWLFWAGLVVALVAAAGYAHKAWREVRTR